MKPTTIQQVIASKVNEWIKSITDPDLRHILSNNVIVAGGAIASLLLGEEPNDYDVYIKDDTVLEDLANYYVSKFKELRTHDSIDDDNICVVRDKEDNIAIKVQSAGISTINGLPIYEYFEQLEPGDPRTQAFIETVGKTTSLNRKMSGHTYSPIYLSSNAITLSDGIQIVTRFYGSPEEIIANFDYVHCCNYWDSAIGRVVIEPNATMSLLTKELIYIGSKYPLCSIIRSRKFINRGFTIGAGEYLKMILQLNDMDLTNVDVLKGQLIGVDTAYFTSLIRAIESAAEANREVSLEYICQLIDKLY